jgi:hypothetical protein
VEEGVSSGEKRGSALKTDLFPSWLGMPSIFGIVIVLAAAGIVTAVVAWNTRGAPDISVQKPSSMSECIPNTVKLVTKESVSTPELVKFAREHCYSLIRSEGLLNNFYVLDMAYIQQYRTNPVLLWLVVGVTISGVILAALQLLAAFQLAMTKNQDMEGGGAMSVKRSEIALKSSVTGLFILLMSFAFFLVFVFYVYRIEPPKDQEPLPPLVQAHSQNGTIDGPPAPPSKQ